jgi:uncharacterized phage-associated protein
MSYRLEYRFDAEKFVNALAFFASRGVADLTKLKAAKLLFFTDKHHLVRYGTPVTGDRYYCLKFGPLPSSADNYMDEAELAAKFGEPFDELFDRFLAVDIAPQHPVFKPVAPPDLDVFSESERVALEHTVAQYGKYTASQLIKLTHEEAAYKISDRGRPEHGRAEMPYELFFADVPQKDAQRILELAKLEQEDRNIAASLIDR